MTSLLVVGAGAVGLYLQHTLQETEGSILLARKDSRLALASEPLRISGQTAVEHVLHTCDWESFPALTPDATILIATKTFALPDVLSSLKPHLRGKEALVFCQNGIGVAYMAQRILPTARIFRLQCWISAEKLAPNRLKLFGAYRFDLAGPAREAGFLARFESVLAATGVATTLARDVRTSEWQKALFHIAASGLCTIADAPNGDLLEHEELRRLAEGLVDETFRVGAAEGVALTEADRSAVFSSLANTTKDVNPLLQDLRAGRRPELEYLNVAISQLGKKHGLATPLNDTVVALVTYLERTGKRRP